MRTHPPAPPRPWRILGAAVGAQAAGAALIGGLPALSEELRTAYGLTVGELGLALASVPAGMALTLFAWGALADRRGERLVMTVGLSGAFVALVAAARAGGLATLLAALFLAGTLAAATNAASGRVIAGAFGPDRRGLALGIRQASLPVGAAVAAAVLPGVAHRWGLAAAMATLAGTCAVAAIVAATSIPGRTSAGRDVAHRSAVERGPFRDARLWRVAGASGLLAGVQFTLIGFLVVYLVQAGLSVAAAAACLVAVQLTGAASRVVVGRWSDLTRSRVRPLRYVAVGIAVAAALAAIAASVPGWPAAVTVLPAALAAQCWNGLSFAATAELAPEGRVGAALGIQNTLVAVCGAGALPVVGALIDATSWGVGFAATAVFAATAALVVGPLAARERSVGVARPGQGRPGRRGSVG